MKTWKDKLYDLAEKRCDPRHELWDGDCLYHIFEPFIEKILKEQKREFKDMVGGIEEFEETYCKKDECLFRSIKKFILKKLKEL